MRNIDAKFLFSLAGLLVVAGGWLALILSLLGLFYALPLGLFFVFAGGSLIFWIAQNRKKIYFSKEIAWAFFLGFFFCAIFTFYTIPTIFTGRDQGAFSSAAIWLSQNHSLRQSFPVAQEFFHLYGPGVALNFPGFSYLSDGSLVTHFPLGYVSYLATFYTFFGLRGMALANALALFFFLISFFLIARVFLSAKSSFISFLLVATAPALSWIFKFTLSENLSLFLVWFGIWQLILFEKERKVFNFLSFIFTFGYLLFVRIEGWLIFPFALGFIFFREKNRRDFLKNILWKKAGWFFIFFFSIFLLSLSTNWPFYRGIVKGFLNSFDFRPEGQEVSVGPFEEFFYVLRVFGAYAILPYLALGIVGIVRFWKKKEWTKLAPFLILLPTLTYLINPSITLDHPWMLRRYVFSVIPLLVLYTVFFLNDFFRRKIFSHLLALFLLLTNLIIFLPYLPVRENKNLLEQTEKLSQNFEQQDLVLVDRKASGDHWSMLSGPLLTFFGKQAVYLFNPNDLEKINLDRFQKVFLIIPDENLAFYKNSSLFERLEPRKDYLIENWSLGVLSGSKKQIVSQPVLLPLYEKNYIYGKIYEFIRINP